MGKIKRGVLGGISGRVGNIIGSSWKGIEYIKCQPLHIRNPRTNKQQKQRSRFSLVLEALTPMLPFVNIAFKNLAGCRSAYNAAMSYNMQNAIWGNYPKCRLDFSKFMVARGNLTMPDPQTAIADRGAVIFSWNDNSAADGPDATDVAMVLVFDKVTNEVFCTTHGTGRRGGPCIETIAIPSRCQYHYCECYLAFISADRRSTSDSVYCGLVLTQ